MSNPSWLSVREEPPSGRSTFLMICSFLIPLGVWSAVSYLPFIWQPDMRFTIAGDSTYSSGHQIKKPDYALHLEKVEQFQKAVAAGSLFLTLDDLEEAPSTAPSARKIGRKNTNTLRQFGPIALANGWIEKDDERNDAVLIATLGKWLNGELHASEIIPNDLNKERLQTIYDDIAPSAADGKIAFPKDRLWVGLQPQGYSANPVFLPAPHEAFAALYTGFITPPRRDEDPWLHERLWDSFVVIAYGFSIAMVIGVPIGLIAGTFGHLSKLIEPFFKFFSYLPPPAFGALLIAILASTRGPKRRWYLLPRFSLWFWLSPIPLDN